MTWEQLLWDLLCELYRKMGGDCSELVPRPPDPVPETGSGLPDVIEEVEARYNLVGIPSFTTLSAKQAFLDLLTAIENHLNLAGNSLPSAADIQLRKLIADMRAAVP